MLRNYAIRRKFVSTASIRGADARCKWLARQHLSFSLIRDILLSNRDVEHVSVLVFLLDANELGDEDAVAVNTLTAIRG